MCLAETGKALPTRVYRTRSQPLGMQKIKIDPDGVDVGSTTLVRLYDIEIKTDG